MFKLVTLHSCTLQTPQKKSYEKEEYDELRMQNHGYGNQNVK